jgi:leucyl-tRNA synthetase
MFAAPPEQSLEWSDSAVEGAYRFLRRLWRQVHGHVSSGQGAPPVDGPEERRQHLRRRVHETIAKVSDDMGRRHTFNTAIAANMELLNELARFQDRSREGRALMQEALEAVVLMLSPIVPHIAYALWSALGRDTPIIDMPWPRPDPRALVQERLELVVQVNGRLRGRISVPADSARPAIEQAALANENVRRFLEGKTVRKVVVVPGRLVNIVAA